MEDDPNVQALANRLTRVQDKIADKPSVEYMRQRMHAVDRTELTTPIAGIDSSDNILLQIPDLPGAGVAGYSFSLVVSEPDGAEHMWREASVERSNDPYNHEDLLIEILYELPTPEEWRIQSIADYQWRTLMSAPTGRVPYLDDHPMFKLRLAAARARDLTEKRATRIFLNQDTARVNTLLRDGRLSSQNCSTRYTDDLARLFVRRGIHWVGVIKQGSLLWTVLYPYHQELSRLNGRQPYWAEIAPELIWATYANSQQTQPKTLLLGAHESQALGGVGGLWVLYSPSPATYYILEFNVYDMEAFRPLVDSGVPLQMVRAPENAGSPLYVVRQDTEGQYQGSQLRVTPRDLEDLVAPVVSEIHHYATVTSVSPNYPIALADAHNRCKITRERKERRNRDLIQALIERGYHPVDFAEFTDDPHKLFER